MANVNVSRQIYNVLGVCVSPSPATGYMYSLGTLANPTSGVNRLTYLPRVQSATIDLSVPREDVNQYGQLNRVDQIIVTQPDVTLNLEYFLVDGFAENLLGFAASGQQAFCSGLIDGTQSEKNYFLGIAPEGVDLIGDSDLNNVNVVGIGNGVVTNYSLNLAVGQIPRASVTIMGNNQQTYNGATGQQSPAIDPNTALQVVGPKFTLPVMSGYTGVNVVSALRPGDIVLGFPRTGSFGDYTSGVGQIHVQGISLSVPIAVDPIMQIGNPYAIAKPIRFPVNCTLTVDALAADVAEDNVANLFCSDTFENLYFQMKQPSCDRNGANAITVWFNQAKLTNRSYNSSIGQNATVRLTYTNQLQGISPSYLGAGVVFSGSYGQAAVS